MTSVTRFDTTQESLNDFEQTQHVSGSSGKTKTKSEKKEEKKVKAKSEWRYKCAKKKLLKDIESRCTSHAKLMPDNDDSDSDEYRDIYFQNERCGQNYYVTDNIEDWVQCKLCLCW